jgi:hypothetical protein
LSFAFVPEMLFIGVSNVFVDAVWRDFENLHFVGKENAVVKNIKLLFLYLFSYFCLNLNFKK